MAKSSFRSTSLRTWSDTNWASLRPRGSSKRTAPSRPKKPWSSNRNTQAMTEAKATLRYVRMSPRKTRPVTDLIRGCPVSDALALLRFTPRAAAKVVRKVLLSAVANGQQPGKELGDADSLRVSRAWVDVGPTFKRFQPRAQGRALAIHKRTSHITIVVAPAEAKGTKKAKG